jgi:hypothetical protein
VHREKIIVQIKGGTGAKDIRDLLGTVENQKAAGGILITLDKPTKPMRDEAASALAKRFPENPDRHHRRPANNDKLWDVFANFSDEAATILRWKAQRRATAAEKPAL